ncbi:U2 small nuclear ribonucleoprotein auxiliary factor 35 kDa subunit-related protein 1 [Peromyscus californicus insignis]|uniref:U2 small nuclear ribonucleoprotein auxiliary factor 35 kDa subunit-related protein 1 n=1 Tax=Peromyscus californicus insignis TaxID=564181 RepID=UPI0022A7B966|nr:U2 small nuclear ribonucleoprotein auxiliary factor 35 kDa subunit-related protein 1 [Peromyscus californicus insignis]
MATQEAVIPEKLSHKKYRAALRKEKRKKRRQNMARLRDLAAPPEEEEDVSTDEQLKEKLLELERQKLHEEWLLREEKAQEEFRIKKRKEEAARKQREEQERQIKLEWEEQQKKQREEEEQKLQEKREREEAVQKMLDQAENDGTWQNPEPPQELRLEKYRASCPFYSKTGACRFGNRCSRKHDFPTSSPTLLVKSMFTTFGMEQCRRDDYDSDASLEYSEEETYQQFLDFYHDVLPEFKNVGKVIQFKVSCNLEPHLRGNVYVQYQSEEECQAALSLFNGRWYAGRQLQCEFCPVTRWKIAICGLFEMQKCPKGKHCNFLHVFRNPNNEFREANRDIYLSPAWTGFSGKTSDKRERKDHHEEYYGKPRTAHSSPHHSSKRNRESERKSTHRKKSHKQETRGHERHSSRRGREEDDSPGPQSQSHRP